MKLEIRTLQNEMRAARDCILWLAGADVNLLERINNRMLRGSGT
jgi:hypothetical protein